MTDIKIDFNSPCHVHFIGIGGISMSGLAQILLNAGFTVSGSDSKASDITKLLEEKGAKISYPQAASNITKDIDLVVYTAAIHDDNPELMAVREKKIPEITRADFLGELMDNYPLSSAVAGTHGKTTTTGMASHILLAAALDPTISIGGILPGIGGNIRIGNSKSFITEACEYKNSFLSLKAKYSVILNAEAEHLDFFKDEDDIRNSFRIFAEGTAKDGAVIICNDIKDYESLIKNAPAKHITFGLKETADFHPKNISFNEKGFGEFDIIAFGKKLCKVSLNVPGKHNISNACAAAALGVCYGASQEAIKTGLSNFGGTNRRFQYKGTLKSGAVLIDDYAHHPTEIKATMQAALNYPHKRIIVVYQPHTYTRTVAFLNDFADALSPADITVFADIYAAREINESGVSSKDISDILIKNGKESYYFNSDKNGFEEISDFLSKKCVDGDLLITMGAGNIDEVGDLLLKK